MLSCPHCQTELDVSELRSEGEVDCPNCGRTVAEEEADFGRVDDDDVSSAGATLGNGSGASLPPAPADSKIDVVESSADRLVFYLPPGSSQTKGIGCFAIFWLLITTAVSGGFLFGGAMAGGPLLLFIIPFFGLFYLIGFGMLYWWYAMKHTSTTVLVTPETFAVQKVLRGKAKVKQTSLLPDSRVELVTSYEVNEKPVYAVTVEGTDATVSFGARLEDSEKKWLQKAVNGFWGKDASGRPQIARFCPQCGAELGQVLMNPATGQYNCPECDAHLSGPIVSGEPQGEPLEIAKPHQLPDDVPIEIEEDTTEELRISWPVTVDGPTRNKIVLGFLLGGLGLLGFGIVVAAFFLWPQVQGGKFDWFDLIFTFFPMLFVLMPASFLLKVYRTIKHGRVVLSLKPYEMRVQLKHGILKVKRTASPAAVTHVLVGTGSRILDRKTEKGASTIDVFGKRAVAALRLEGEDAWPLTSNHDEEFAVTLAGLISGRLTEMGYEHRAERW